MSHDEPTAVLTTRPAPPGTAAEGPPPALRSLAPDLARGMLLLFIASANVWGYLWSSGGFNEVGYRPAGGTTLDHLVDGLVAFFVDDRSRPMFAILYGFGLAVMASRLTERGVTRKGVRRVLARRSWWLVAFGLVHATLLFHGDILAPYGVTGLVALAFLHRSPRVLAVWFWGASALATAAGCVMLFGLLDLGMGEGDGAPVTSYLESAVERAVASGVVSVASLLLLFFVPQVVLGILLARAGWLTRPWDHRRELGRVAVGAAVVNLVFNLPYALAVAQLWRPDATTNGVLELAHYLSGVVMGFGYVCLFGWVAAVLRDRPRRGVVSAVAAVGERSLTSYLLQSVMFAPLLSAWGLGLGGRIGTAQAAVLAIGVWLVTVLVAVAMHRAGRRGPFEVLLRRLTYGRGGAGVAVPVRAAVHARPADAVTHPQEPGARVTPHG
ncbi:DUF418 domain-containing protein [Cellulomonas cellasea]|uniref:DUF418 domain-containing protein n=1 Tax=Cellulomonas cellasea TaxID=43670 RepID=A0A4Y3KWN6_9CELL|nr:DUF418 domain-containing protein [Cellulomonas cellasea]GEA87816.1 hypothetical protein CCE01nite_17650 [Cellulomonas cellasea]